MNINRLAYPSYFSLKEHSITVGKILTNEEFRKLFRPVEAVFFKHQFDEPKVMISKHTFQTVLRN